MILNIKREPRTGPVTQYASPFMRIYTASSSASCGVPFQIGRDFIIAGSYVTSLDIMSISSYLV